MDSVEEAKGRGATAPVGMHVANGMYGQIYVHPKTLLPAVDHEYYVMQSEFYTKGAYGEAGTQPSDMEKALAEKPDYVVFNGYVGAIAGDRALTAKVGGTFANDRKLSPDRWTFLTGDQAGVCDLAVALDFKYQQVGKEFSHSNLIAVLDGEGNVVHRLEALGADIAPTLEAVKRLLPDSPRGTDL